MTLTEKKSIELRSNETWSGTFSKNLLVSAAVMSAAISASPPVELSKAVYESGITLGSYSTITPRQPLGPASRMNAGASLVNRLLDLRQRAIGKGMPLLNQDEILLELQKRRGEVG